MAFREPKTVFTIFRELRIAIFNSIKFLYCDNLYIGVYRPKTAFIAKVKYCLVGFKVVSNIILDSSTPIDMTVACENPKSHMNMDYPYKSSTIGIRQVPSCQ